MDVLIEQTLVIGLYSAIAAAVLFGIVGMVKRSRKSPQPIEQAIEETDDPEISYMDAYPRCEVCGDLATEPMPQVVRNRSGLMRMLGNLLGLPPIYARRVNKNGAARLCKSDAHLADADTDLFIANDVRGELARANNAIARRAAQFEVTLIERLREERERQKTPAPQASRALSTLRSIKPAANE